MIKITNVKIDFINREITKKKIRSKALFGLLSCLVDNCLFLNSIGFKIAKNKVKFLYPGQEIPGIKRKMLYFFPFHKSGQDFEMAIVEFLNKDIEKTRKMFSESLKGAEKRIKELKKKRREERTPREILVLAIYEEEKQRLGRLPGKLTLLSMFETIEQKVGQKMMERLERQQR